jgi:hypothetical protein
MSSKPRGGGVGWIVFVLMVGINAVLSTIVVVWVWLRAMGVV